MSFLKDVNFWIGLAGIPLGIWGIYLTLRHKDPGEITFCRESVIGLFSDIAKNIEGLEIKYRKEPVGENLQFFKAYFINTGRKDITEDMTDRPLSLILKDEARWVEAKVIAASPEVDVNAAITNNSTLEFSFSMLRRGEFFCFEALVDIPSGKSLKKICEPVHRIADTRKIPQEPISLQKPRVYKLYIIQLFLFAIGLIVTLWLPQNQGFKYQYTPEGSTNSIKVIVSPRSNGTVEVLSKKFFPEKIKTFQSVEEFRGCKQVEYKEAGLKPEIFAFVICLSLSTFISIPILYIEWQAFKARRMLNLKDDPSNNFSKINYLMGLIIKKLLGV